MSSELQDIHSMIANQDTALAVEQMLRQCTSIMNDTIRTVMQSSPPDEFQRFRSAAAPIMASMFLDLLKPIYAMHPTLGQDDSGDVAS
jgi:hypothetical protein